MKNFANETAAVLVAVAAAVIVAAVLLWVEGGSMSWEPEAGTYQTPISKTVSK